MKFVVWLILSAIGAVAAVVVGGNINAAGIVGAIIAIPVGAVVSLVADKLTTDNKAASIVLGLVMGFVMAFSMATVLPFGK